MFARWPGGDERSLVPVAFGPGSAGLRHRLPAPGAGGPRILVVMDEDPFESEAGFAGMGVRGGVLLAVARFGDEGTTPIQQEGGSPPVGGKGLGGEGGGGPRQTGGLAPPGLRK